MYSKIVRRKGSYMVYDKSSEVLTTHTYLLNNSCKYLFVDCLSLNILFFYCKLNKKRLSRKAHSQHDVSQ